MCVEEWPCISGGIELKCTRSERRRVAINYRRFCQNIIRKMRKRNVHPVLRSSWSMCYHDLWDLEGDKPIFLFLHVVSSASRAPEKSAPLFLPSKIWLASVEDGNRDGCCCGSLTCTCQLVNDDHASDVHEHWTNLNSWQPSCIMHHACHILFRTMNHPSVRNLEDVRLTSCHPSKHLTHLLLLRSQTLSFF